MGSVSMRLAQLRRQGIVEGEHLDGVNCWRTAKAALKADFRARRSARVSRAGERETPWKQGVSVGGRVPKNRSRSKKSREAASERARDAVTRIRGERYFRCSVV